MSSSSSSAHVALERNDAERPENEGEEDGNRGDESGDECDSESDDDDEVVAFVDESDSETEVPVNTPGSARTRASRLSIAGFQCHAIQNRLK